jgi:hypothetical protein
MSDDVIVKKYSPVLSPVTHPLSMFNRTAKKAIAHFGVPLSP